MGITQRLTRRINGGDGGQGLPWGGGSGGGNGAMGGGGGGKTYSTSSPSTSRSKGYQTLLKSFAYFLLTVAVYYSLYEVVTKREHARGLQQALKLDGLSIPMDPLTVFPEPLPPFRYGDADPVLPILMPAYGRPDYLETVFKAVEAMDGIHETVLVVSQDGSNPTVAKMVADLSTRIRVVHMNHTRPFLTIPTYLKDGEYATSENVKFLLRFAFEELGAPGAIVLESDLVPSKDFYRYFLWTHRNFQRLPVAEGTPRGYQGEGHAARYPRGIFTVNGYTPSSREAVSNPYVFQGPKTDGYKGKFMVWGWSISRDRWPAVLRGWTWFNNWDINMQWLRKTPSMDLSSISSEVSRVKNVGMTGINFHIDDDPEEKKRFGDVYIPSHTISYSEHDPVINV